MEMETVQTTVLSPRSQCLAAWKLRTPISQMKNLRLEPHVPGTPGTCHIPGYFVKSLLQSPIVCLHSHLKVKAGFLSLGTVDILGPDHYLW